MALDRWIALIIALICLAYGYGAFFTMDGLLPPFMQRNPIWPSTFPKILAVLGLLTSLFVLLGFEKSDKPREEDPSVIVYRRLFQYKIGQALTLIGLMIAYALLLRPAGFLISTVGFLVIGAIVLGERKLHVLIPVAAIATGVVWFLVQEVLGIFLRPLPFFLGTGG
ncbi:MAG: tripartite tricarboxylate transporter TctB family protein [Pseudomonadota bacterium]